MPSEISPPLDLQSEALSKLVSTEEFYKKFRNVIGRRMLLEVQFHDPIQVEHEATQFELEQILAHIASVWSSLGTTDPHWSVVSTSDFRADKIEQNMELFRNTGKQEALNFDRILARVGRQLPANATGLEYGCGVARVTRWLAGRVEEMIGVDISPQHLALARQYLDESAVQNTRLICIREVGEVGNLPEADLVYSKIVLQHNPPPVIALILNDLCSILKPGGIGVIQIPTFCKNYKFVVAEYLAQMGSMNQMEMHVLPQPVVYQILSKNNCIPLEVSRDHLVTTVDYVSSTFVFEKRL